MQQRDAQSIAIDIRIIGALARVKENSIVFDFPHTP
jgi:hypothetical protein